MISSFLTPAKRHRDLTLIKLNEEQTLVVACDSAGAIGPKEADVIHVPGYVLGRLTARVALMEVLSVGAFPICVVNTLTVEPNPTGEDINRGVEDEISILGIEPKGILTGSTEKNIPTSQSGIGVTVIGLVETAKIQINAPEVDDIIVLFGYPKVGQEVKLDDPDSVDLLTVQTLLNNRNVKEIIPIGSQGIKAEVENLLRLYKMKFSWKTQENLDIEKSAGPSTCLIAVCKKVALDELSRSIKKPINVLGLLDNH